MLFRSLLAVAVFIKNAFDGARGKAGRGHLLVRTDIGDQGVRPAGEGLAQVKDEALRRIR